MSDEIYYEYFFDFLENIDRVLSSDNFSDVERALAGDSELFTGELLEINSGLCWDHDNIHLFFLRNFSTFAVGVVVDDNHVSQLAFIESARLEKIVVSFYHDDSIDETVEKLSDFFEWLVINKERGFCNE